MALVPLTSGEIGHLVDVGTGVRFHSDLCGCGTKGDLL